MHEELASAHRRIGDAVLRLQRINPAREPATARASLGEVLHMLAHARDDLDRYFEDVGKARRKRRP